MGCKVHSEALVVRGMGWTDHGLRDEIQIRAAYRRASV